VQAEADENPFGDFTEGKRRGSGRESRHSRQQQAGQDTRQGRLAAGAQQRAPCELRLGGGPET
jgi:hypothetical protein